jgi:hypothetical protein
MFSSNLSMFDTGDLVRICTTDVEPLFAKQALDRAIPAQPEGEVA